MSVLDLSFLQIMNLWISLILSSFLTLKPLFFGIFFQKSLSRCKFITRSAWAPLSCQQCPPPLHGARWHLIHCEQCNNWLPFFVSSHLCFSPFSSSRWVELTHLYSRSFLGVQSVHPTTYYVLLSTPCGYTCAQNYSHLKRNSTVSTPWCWCWWHIDADTDAHTMTTENEQALT